MTDKYRFQKIINFKKKGDHWTMEGPMSPVGAIQCLMNSNMGFQKVHGGARVDNDQSYDCTYDHLIVVRRYSNCNLYCLFVDMGASQLPCAIWHDDEENVTITPIYLKQTTEEMMRYHLENMEHPVRANTTLENMQHPIMVLNNDDFIQIFKEAEASGCLKGINVKKKVK